MITIRVLINVQSEKKVEFLGLLGQEAINVRQLEGCAMFRVFEDVADETALFLYEEWQTLAAFDVYRTSEPFKQNGQKLFPLMVGKADSAYYSAEVFS
jgi:quinol monooxygenase YgiN